MTMDMYEIGLTVNEEIVEWRGDRYLYEWIEGEVVDKFKPYTLVHGICFDEKSNVLIQKEYETWRFQGGAPEGDETFEETVTREMSQETGIIPTDIHVFGAFKVKGPLGSDKEKDFFQLCTVSRVGERVLRTPDPEDGTIDEIKFVHPSEASFYVDWGRHGRQMLEVACRYYQKYATRSTLTDSKF